MGVSRRGPVTTPGAADQGVAPDTGERTLLLGPDEGVETGCTLGSGRRSRSAGGAEAAAIATSPITAKVRIVAHCPKVGRVPAAPDERDRDWAVTSAGAAGLDPLDCRAGPMPRTGRNGRWAEGPRRSQERSVARGTAGVARGTAAFVANAARIRRRIDVTRPGRARAIETRTTPAAARRAGVAAYAESGSAGRPASGFEGRDRVGEDPTGAAGGATAIASEVTSAPGSPGPSHGRSQSRRPVSRRRDHIPIESSTILGSIARPSGSRGTSRIRIARKPRTTNAPTRSSTSDGHPGQSAGRIRRPRRS